MRRLRLILRAVALLAILFGVPYVLVNTVGWQGPSNTASLDDFQRNVMRREFGFRVLLAVVVAATWIAWAQVAFATAWELIVNLRRARSNLGPRAMPIVPPRVGQLVGDVIISVAVGDKPASDGPTLSPGPLAVDRISLDERSTVTTDGTLTPATGPARKSKVRDTQPARSIWTVKLGDTLWDIAETTLGDGARVGELIAINPHVSATGLVRPGDEILLPDRETSGEALDGLYSFLDQQESDEEPIRPYRTFPGDDAHAELPPLGGSHESPKGSATLPPPMPGSEARNFPDQKHAPTASTAPEPNGLGGATTAAVAVQSIEKARRWESVARADEICRDPRQLSTELALRHVALGSRAGTMRRCQRWLRAQHAAGNNLGILVRLIIDPDDGTATLTFQDQAGNRTETTLPRARLASSDLDPDSEETELLPTLVSIGADHRGREIFVDLEGLGRVSVSGPDRPVSELFRAIGAQLATTTTQLFRDRDRSDRRVPLSEIDLDLVRRPAVSGATTVDNRAGSAAEARATRPRTKPVVPLVVLATDSEVGEPLSRSALPGSGVVVLSTFGEAPYRWTITENGKLRLEDGFVVDDPAVLSSDAAEQIHEILSGSARRNRLRLHQVLQVDPTDSAKRSDVAPEPLVPLEWVYVVRLMRDEIDVINTDGDTVQFESDASVETIRPPDLIAFMLNRGSVGVAEVTNAFRCSSKQLTNVTLKNLVTQVDRGIGPHRIVETDNGWQLDRQGLITDVDLLDHVTDHVASNPTDAEILMNSLSLVAARPLRTSRSRHWASAYLLLPAISETIERAVVLAGTLSIADGRLDDARRSYEIGIRADPTNESAYQLGFEVEAIVGDAEKVHRLFKSLETRLSAAFRSSPLPQTIAARDRALRSIASAGVSG